jgi:hypothetical protein
MKLLDRAHVVFYCGRFQLHYPELVQDCKPDIVAATAACDEVCFVYLFLYFKTEMVVIFVMF